MGKKWLDIESSPTPPEYALGGCLKNYKENNKQLSFLIISFYLIVIFIFQLHCSRENLRRYKNFRTVTLNCTLRFTREKCPFGLFAVRKSFGILVYEHGNHNHELREIGKKFLDFI